MRVSYVQVEKASAPLKLVTREVPESQSSRSEAAGEACSLCHSESVTVAGLFPFVSYRCAPGFLRNPHSA